jgi:hypothetical protein
MCTGNNAMQIIELCVHCHHAGCMGLQLSVIIENLLRCQCFDHSVLEGVTVQLSAGLDSDQVVGCGFCSQFVPYAHGCQHM